MKALKKVICVLASVCILLCLASCSAVSEKGGTEAKTEISEEKKTQTGKTTESAEAEITTKAGEEVTLGYFEKAEKLSLGKISEKGYENKSAGFKISSLGESWKEATPKQIASSFNCGIDQDSGKALYSISEDASLYYLCDVMYVNKDDDSVVSVSLLENEKGKNLESILLEDEGNDLVKGFESSQELMYIKIANKKAACKKITYFRTQDIVEIPNLTEYDIFLLSKDKKQAVKIVIVCIEGKTEIDEIVKHFVALE